ncbi:MAG: Ig-like domain-containing protein [Gemmatimonadaceae bacterium]
MRSDTGDRRTGERRASRARGAVGRGIATATLSALLLSCARSDDRHRLVSTHRTDDAAPQPPVTVVDSVRRANQSVAPRATVASLEVVRGDGQSSIAGRTLPVPLTVRVLDERGQPVAGEPVAWLATGGASSIGPSRRRTDKTGQTSAQLTLGFSADTQFATASVANGASVRFHAVTPAASLRLAPDAESAWVGDAIPVVARLADSAGQALTAARLSWSVADPRVASVSETGVVIGRSPGTVTVRAEHGGAASDVALTFLAIARGRVLAGTGADTTTLRVYIETIRGLDSAEVAPDGRFEVRARAAVHDTLDVLVRDVGGLTRYHQARVRLAATDLATELRIVPVPERWTVHGGAYDGATVPVSVAAALALTADRSRFARVHRPSNGGIAQQVSWPTRAFPIPVAFRRDSTDGPVSASDSSTFWRLVGQLETDLGLDLFRPAAYADVIERDGAIRVAVDPTMSGNGLTFVTWGNGGDIHAGDVSFRSAGTMRDPRVVAHEMMHALGFGHTSGWPTVMNPPNVAGADRLTRQDVAYTQLILRLRELQAASGARYGFLAAAPEQAMRE